MFRNLLACATLVAVPAVAFAHSWSDGHMAYTVSPQRTNIVGADYIQYNFGYYCVDGVPRIPGETTFQATYFTNDPAHFPPTSIGVLSFPQIYVQPIDNLHGYGYLLFRRGSLDWYAGNGVQPGFYELHLTVPAPFSPSQSRYEMAVNTFYVYPGASVYALTQANNTTVGRFNNIYVNYGITGAAGTVEVNFAVRNQSQSLLQSGQTFVPASPGYGYLTIAPPPGGWPSGQDVGVFASFRTLRQGGLANDWVTVLPLGTVCRVLP